MRVSEIIDILNKQSPQGYACSWDNVGLVVGRKEQEVHKILIALDATMDVVDYAVRHHYDFILTHHPMIFSNMKQINDTSFVGDKILKLAEHKIACFAMHTNFDIVGGMSDIFAGRLNLVDCIPLEVTVDTETEWEGIGRIGYLNQHVTITLGDLAMLVKSSFDLKHIMVYGDLEAPVHRIAVSPGSGRSIINEAVEKGADVLITGDIGHHEGLDALDQNLMLIDASHYGTEYIFIEAIEQYLADSLPEDITVDHFYSGIPFEVI
ncbi:MAG: Nif3-like dinuclear metal center hexameric protein [Lachnospiraceae bacterium]